MGDLMLRDLGAIRRPLTAFASMGLLWGAFAAQVPVLKAAIDASDARFGLLLSVSAIGLLTALVVAPWVERLLGDLSLPLAVVLLPLAFLIPATAAAPLVFGIGMFLVATASGLEDVLMNARVAEIEAAEGRSLMNLAHAGFSLAYAASAFATGFAREAGWSPGAVYGALLIVVASLAATARQPVEPVGEDAGNAGLGWRVAALCGLLVLLAFQIEGSVEAWSALHVERTLGGSPAEGAWGPAMLGLTMGVGRLSGQAATRVMPPMGLALLAAGVTAFGGTIAASAPSVAMAYLGFALIGLGVSVIGPLGIAEAGRRAAPGGRTTAVARTAVIGFGGFLVGPPIMGLVSGAFSLRWAIGMIAILALSCAVIAVLLGAIGERPPKRATPQRST